MAANYVTSALEALGFDVQSCCNELAFWALRADDHPDAYDAWNAAFHHRNTPPTVHDVEWCNALELIGLSLHIDNRSAEAGTYLQEALAYKERTLSHGNKRVHILLDTGSGDISEADVEDEREGSRKNAARDGRKCMDIGVCNGEGWEKRGREASVREGI
ncbi:unnamed protein product [Alternaria alternata]